ncbi:hypothetical protein [environmental halophage 1 AAJ-2005]|nr:hypothetical protein [environmental halophage 1 AAJ-2005]
MNTLSRMNAVLERVVLPDVSLRLATDSDSVFHASLLHCWCSRTGMGELITAESGQQTLDTYTRGENSLQLTFPSDMSSGGDSVSPSPSSSSSSSSCPSPDDTYRDSEWLRDQYVGKQQSQHEIADKCEVSDATNSTWLTKFGIERDIPGTDTYRDKGWLRKQYVEQEKTQTEIADECGVAVPTISDWLSKCGISRD